MSLKNQLAARYLSVARPRGVKGFLSKTRSIKALPQYAEDKTQPSGIKKLRMKKELKG